MITIISFTFILLYILSSISIEDIKTMLISEKKLISLVISGLLYLLCIGLTNEKINTIDLLLNNSFSMLIVFIVMFSISHISYKTLGVNSLGMGDIKLSSFSTIWLGIELSFLSLSISFLLSAIYSLYRKLTKRFIPLQQYPFAPFLSIGIFYSWIIDKI
ncbi:prepilin peptidase [Prochlorococcus marinus]|uniref:Prepilin peptidase n=1 Tax=Prochlorococcus marinus str. PAC1 TaxID=59924 RepID=A0A0A2BZV6_PROMR|nr:prepilin peptidase [Prochlorococcus marinus]KGG19611.1 Prepilin peptidase [Prochlorococcus marinus str. PAC1]